MRNLSENDIRYQEAKRMVKRIKGFYMSAFIYVAVNIFLLFLNYEGLKPGESIWHIEYFIVPVVWGVIQIFYGFTVFFPGFFLGKNWEDKKINELIDKYEDRVK
ncbi:2TM domain-containing protein [Chryseobacterium gallinarum]|uniref:2TM domain-containing protein n=1 Tax=Chryseobacterium gallinarum TaxID=1324352 RepID=A0ABX6KSY8_CHRGL|nr:2TM domain-containing protein [Chryseobacterium gallinarum]QIY91731.1 2TM domain-containing protein [Chryseobacterium gallinarum]